MPSEMLRREFNYLGIDETTFSVLALLPLVQVAWADGAVQEQERSLILQLARENWSLDRDAMDLLDSWLRHPPTQDYIERGRRALVALAQLHPELGIHPGGQMDVLELSKRVAKAAGGFMGFRAVHASEAEVLDQIAAALHATGHSPLLDDEEDVSDEATDVLEEEEMLHIREAAHLAAPTAYKVEGEVLADLIHHGADGGTLFEIGVQGISIGRSRSNEVQIPHDHRLSRNHARIVVEDRKIYIVDGDTTNGTFVNGQRITRRRLFGAEQIRCGDAHFTFLLR